MSNAVFNIVMNVLTNETKQIHTLGDLVCIKSDIKKSLKSRQAFDISGLGCHLGHLQPIISNAWV